MVRSGAGSVKRGLVLLAVALSGCSAGGGPGRKSSSTGATLTPPSYYTTYYSTQKARQLGETYSHNLDQLVEQVVQGPIGRLQFANAIVSISIGFFTHSASYTPDERYLEAILGMPDILDEKTEVSVNIDRLFSQYGRELLSLLADEGKIANDPKVAGYGLNFSWRSLARTPSGPRMTLEGAVIYIRKEKAKRFLNRQIEQDELLGTATIFSRHGEQPPQLVRYSLPSPQPETQSPPQQATPLTTPQIPPKESRPEVTEEVSQKTPRAELQPEAKVREEQQPAQITTASKTSDKNPQPSPSEAQRTQVAQAAESRPAPLLTQRPAAQSDTLFDTHKGSSQSQVPPAPTTGRQPSSRGYLVQLSFSDPAEAERWSDLLSKGGYTTSLSKMSRDIRLRIGSFPSLTEATRFLEGLKAQGLQGLILLVVE